MKLTAPKVLQTYNDSSTTKTQILKKKTTKEKSSEKKMPRCYIVKKPIQQYSNFTILKSNVVMATTTAATLTTNGGGSVAIEIDDSEKITPIRSRVAAAVGATSNNTATATVVFRSDEPTTVAGPISPTEACVAPTCYNNTLENRGKCFFKFITR